MTIPVLLLLAALWGVVLIPPMLRARAQGSSGIPDFTAKLSRLAHRNHDRPTGAIPVSLRGPIGGRPSGLTPMQRRRRDLLFGLAGAVFVTFAAASIANTLFFWALHLLVDVVGGGYVYLLVKMKQGAAERAAKVRYLPRRSAPTHIPVRKSASR